MLGFSGDELHQRAGLLVWWNHRQHCKVRKQPLHWIVSWWDWNSKNISKPTTINIPFTSPPAQNQTEVPMSMLIMSLNFGGCSEINMKIESLNTIECEKEKLHSALCELFVSYSKGYVHRRSECWALIKSGKAFYIFDPLGIEIREKKMLQKRAVLYKFDTFDAMVDQLMICVESLCEFEDEEMLCVGAISACAGDPCPPVEAPATNPKKKCEKKPKCSPKSEEPPLMMKEIEPQCKPPCEPTEGTFVQCMAFEELCN